MTALLVAMQGEIEMSLSVREEFAEFVISDWEGVSLVFSPSKCPISIIIELINNLAHTILSVWSQ